MMNRRIVVCGSAKFNDYSLLESSLNEILGEYSNDTIEIVSGHAKGADSLGERYANEHNLKCIIFAADWKQYGRAAGPIRNSKMLEYAKQSNPLIIAFWDGESHGTKDTINKAKKLNIRCEVIMYKEIMRNTFEGFIVNDSNRDAFEFANKVAKQETKEANPLFISGPYGCGKSHLIDGIWHYYVCADNGKHPEWLSSFALTDRFKNFTQGKEQFADKFNELDLIMFDDIDLVDDKCNGELLSQVIDELIKRGKQICVASTKPLNDLPQPLIDVISKGKCVTVSLPTKEEQRDFYKQLSKREGISLHGEEPYDYLCEKQKDFRAMKAEFARLKYSMICENCETASLGVGAVKRYLEN